LFGDCPADAAGAAGDQRCLADEVLRHAWLLTVWAAEGDGVWVGRSRWG
jgi:hypothetical protein